MNAATTQSASGEREDLESLARQLCDSGLTVAVAESCTGGMISARLTDVPGSSAFFRGGFVAYSNRMKVAELGVPGAVLDSEGAVSGPVARALAEGARARLKAGFGIGVTGIAGPDGGTADKPVGLVFIAVAGAAGCCVHRFEFAGDRAAVREQATVQALGMLAEAVEP